MSHSLIVYEHVGACLEENTSLYLVPNDKITDEMRGWLEEAHDKLINADDDNFGMEFLHAAITTPKYKDDVVDQLKEFACIFHEFKMNMDKPWNNPELGINHIYVSGFVY
jgi:hypothetical protein